MIGVLPKTLTVGGIDYAIRSDFRPCYSIMMVLDDCSFSESNKMLYTLETLYERPETIPLESRAEALEQAVWFLRCGRGAEPEGDDAPKLMDWRQDEPLIYAGIAQVTGRDIREDDYCHWWSFMGYYMSIGEGPFSTVVGLRMKLSSGKKLDEGERYYYHHNRHIVDFHQAEDANAAVKSWLAGE